MISVILPTLNAAPHLGPTLASLLPATVDGLVSEAIVADGGSDDGTQRIAEAWGATLVASQPGRGVQLAAGAMRAAKPWLLFLHADTRLAAGWEAHVERFLGNGDGKAAAFRFRLADDGLLPRLVETGVALRCALFSLPYGDQGLLISRRLYDEVGGFKPLPIMEDVDFARRLGRRRMVMLPAAALTSAERYKSRGYLRRVARNWTCLALYYAGVSPARIARLYR